MTPKNWIFIQYIYIYIYIFKKKNQYIYKPSKENQQDFFRSEKVLLNIFRSNWFISMLLAAWKFIILMWPNVFFFVLFFSWRNLCSVISFTLSTLPGIFKYTNFELFNCTDGIVPYSGFSGLNNSYIYIYIYIYICSNNRYILSTYFYIYPFKLSYWFYDIRWALINKSSLIN